jgi:hypothetical protein
MNHARFEATIVQAATMEEPGLSPSLMTAQLLPSSKLPT